MRCQALYVFTGGKIWMAHRAARAFWRGTLDGDQLRSAFVVLHVATGPTGAGGSNFLLPPDMGQGVQQADQQQQRQQPEGQQQPQDTLVPYSVRVVCYRMRSGAISWCLSAGVAALVAALGAAHGDRVLMARLPDGRVTIRLLSGAEREAGAGGPPRACAAVLAGACTAVR